MNPDDELWAIVDARTNKRATVASFYSQIGAIRQIQAWQKRASLGRERLDVAHLAPYLKAVPAREVQRE